MILNQYQAEQSRRALSNNAILPPKTCIGAIQSVPFNCVMQYPLPLLFPVLHILLQKFRVAIIGKPLATVQPK